MSIPSDLSSVKKAADIYIRQQIIPNQPGSHIAPPQNVTLNVKIEEFQMRMSQTGTKVLDIIVTLLTIGKVRVEFLSHTERLELVNSGDIMNSEQAIKVFESYICSKETRQKIVFSGKQTQQNQFNPEFTGKIVIQNRRI